MAESMKGLKRTHRCAELTKGNIGETVHRYGMGTEEQKQRRDYFCGFKRPFRHPAVNI